MDPQDADEAPEARPPLLAGGEADQIGLFSSVIEATNTSAQPGFR